LEHRKESKTIDSKDYRVLPDTKIDFGKWPTIAASYAKTTKQYKALLLRHLEKLSSRQQFHYASHRQALLLIFQGMDAAGKDGAIRHVMSGVNPEACEVFSFEQPSAEELEHDFLCRTTCRLPERGRIGIFQPILLRGGARRSSAPGTSPQQGARTRVAQRQEHLGTEVWLDRRFGEPFHLHRYVDEQAFRYNNRATKDNPLTDYDRFMLALSQISGKRLTYAELTGKVGETAGW